MCGTPHVHVRAFVHALAQIHPSCRIDAMACVLEGARIGARAVIGAGAVVGEGVAVGEESVIHAGARLSNCVVGNQCVIHQGVCIGQDGFGFELSTSENDGGGLHRKKPQLLNVVLADSVEVGANSAIDRGSWRDTFIGSGTKIDNLVQVGHNVHIGARCIIAAQCGIGGSVTMGQYVFIGAQVGIHQHKNLGDFAKVAAKSGVMHDIPAHAVYGGYPAMPIKQFHRQSIFMRNSVLEWANQKRADYSRR